MQRIDSLDINPSIFIDSPAEFLVEQIVSQIKLVPQWSKVFGDAIDSYLRMDYGIRNFPALRIYCPNYIKEFESWFINGSILMDVIFPPGIRRMELQKYQQVVSSALLQQFRRDVMFSALGNLVPGLNELGKRFEVDQEKGFIWGESGEICPLTQIKINFRIDLRIWDLHLEETGRTKDDPFDVTLKNLDLVAFKIQALLDDDSTVELESTIDVKI